MLPITETHFLTSVNVTEHFEPPVGNGSGGPAAAGQGNGSSPAPSGTSGTILENPFSLRGRLRIGRMSAPRDTFSVFENPDLRLIFETVSVTTDTIIEFLDDADCSVLDADTHHWTAPPSNEYLDAIAASIQPLPHVWWSSHSKGLKLVYVGPNHRERAIAAALSFPASFKLEILRHTRHPASKRSDMPEAACGPVHFAQNPSNFESKFNTVGQLSKVALAALIESLELEIGRRYKHDRCLIAPNEPSDSSDPVSVLETGVYCFRCAARGQSYRQNLQPGFVPFATLAEPRQTIFDSLAGHRVHWIHARLELLHLYPNVGETVLREAYSKTLRALYGETDSRIELVFDSHLDFVRGWGVWLHATTHEITKIDSDAANGLPYALDLERDSDGNAHIRPNPVRRAQVKNRDPFGYTPVRPFRGIDFTEDGSSIPVLAGPTSKFPIKLLTQALDLNQALVLVERAFPKLDRAYFQASIAAAICAQRGKNQLPMLTASGPTGSGKGETIRLAASFFDDDAVKVQPLDDAEVFMRNVGMVLASGARFIVIDELAKIPHLSRKIGGILQLSSNISWRPLYANARLQTPCRAAFFFPSVRFPDFLCSSPEFVRRTRHLYLHRQVPDWRKTSGGDTIEWRGQSKENALAANSILTHVFTLCQRNDFQFSKVADELGLVTLADSENILDHALLRNLYRHTRGELGRRVLFEKDPTFARGWIDLTATESHALISAFVPLDDADTLKAARRLAQNNLESVPWNDVLGIEGPPIQCRVRIHGNRWGLRFQSAESCLRGRELVNEQLPPCAITDDGAKIPAPVPSEKQSPSINDDRVTEALTAGGLPT